MWISRTTQTSFWVPEQKDTPTQRFNREVAAARFKPSGRLQHLDVRPAEPELSDENLGATLPPVGKKVADLLLVLETPPKTERNASTLQIWALSSSKPLFGCSL